MLVGWQAEPALLALLPQPALVVEIAAAELPGLDPSAVEAAAAFDAALPVAATHNR